MRKKISIGFLSLVLLLLFAGVISVYELRRLRNQAMEVIELNRRNTQFADRMLDGLQMQNSALLNAFFNENPLPDPAYDRGRIMFDDAYEEASGNNSDIADISTVREANLNYHRVISEYMDNTKEMTREEFLTSYLDAYYNLDQMLKNYLTSPANSIPTRATTLEENVYKTITPSILTLCIAIIIVLMFYFFIDSYYVKPLTKIYKSLGNSLLHNLPFEPHFESNDDELNGLRDMIGELMERKKQ